MRLLTISSLGYLLGLCLSNATIAILNLIVALEFIQLTKQHEGGLRSITWLLTVWLAINLFAVVLMRGLIQRFTQAVISYIEKLALSATLEVYQRINSRNLTLVITGLQELVTLSGLVASMSFALRILTTQSHYFILLSIFIGFALYTLIIAQLSQKVIKKIYTAGRERISRSYTYFSLAWAINFWGIKPELIEQLMSFTKQELKLKNYASALRSFSVYSAAFGQIIFIIAITLAGGVTRNNTPTSVIIFWMSSFVLANLLSINGVLPNLSAAFYAFKELISHAAVTAEFPKGNPKFLVGKKLILDDGWDIWSGSLLENVIDAEAIPYLKQLRIAQELKLHSFDDFASYELLSYGENLSHGQKIRILLIRGIRIMILQEITVISIFISLSGLDQEVLQNVKYLFTTLANEGYSLQLSRANFLILDMNNCSYQPVKQDKQTEAVNYTPDAVETEITPSKLIHTNKLFNNKNLILSLMFIIPATCMNYVGSVLITNQAKLTTLVIINLTGFSLAIILGISIEIILRKNIAINFKLILNSCLHRSLADNMQLASRDFEILSNRICWYIHDIAWIANIGLLSVLPLCYQQHFGLLFVLILGYGLIFILFSPKIKSTRQTSVKLFNQFIQATIDLKIIAQFKSLPQLSSYYKKLKQNATNHYFRANFEKLAVKQLALIAVSGLTYVYMLFSYTTQNTSLILSGIALTTLINLEMRVGVLFSAITGLIGERESMLRFSNTVEHPNETMQAIPLSASAQTNLNALVRTYPLITLSGNSGSGKSKLLVSLTQQLKLIYFDHNCKEQFPQLITLNMISSLNRLDSILELLSKHSGRTKIIILDEAFTDLSISQATTMIIKLSQKSLNYSLIVVDHRLQLGKVITLTDFYARLYT